MAEPSGELPQAVGESESVPGGSVMNPSYRNSIPFALECGRQKAIICMAPGISPTPGESGGRSGTNAFLGVSMGRVMSTDFRV